MGRRGEGSRTAGGPRRGRPVDSLGPARHPGGLSTDERSPGDAVGLPVALGISSASL